MIAIASTGTDSLQARPMTTKETSVRSGDGLPAGRSNSPVTTLLGLGIALALLLVGATASVSQAAVGDHFSFAPVSANGTDAPAFPGTQTFWAGVCDLEDGIAATLEPHPAEPFPGCIEHRGFNNTPSITIQSVVPPLASGVTSPDPDGWIENLGLAPSSGPSWRLEDVTQAGAHPDGSAAMWFSRSPERGLGSSIGTGIGPDGAPRNIRVSLPRGVVGNPNAIPKCPADALHSTPTNCPPKTQVGVSTLTVNHSTAVFPVYNVEPRDGKTAEIVISGAGYAQVLTTNVPAVATARTDGDFGIDATAVDVPAGLIFISQTFTFWGVPWAASHDRYRPVAGYCGASGGSGTDASNATQTLGMAVTGLTGGVSPGKGGVCSHDPQPYDPSWGPIKPFLTTQTECAPANPVTSIFATNWHTPVTAAAESPAPPIDGCEDVEFDASFSLGTSPAADSATGLDVDLAIPQNNEPPASLRFNPDDDTGAPAHWKSTAGLARAHLKDSTVTLPQGFSVNPSAATGLQGCSDAQIGLRDASTNPPLFNNGDPFDGNIADGVECPQGSMIGTAEVSTPLLEEKLTGQVVLGSPKSTDPQSGEMFRMFLVLRNRERGLVAKIYGSAVANPSTGQLTATFANNPQVPFDNLKLSFKGGGRGILATPQRCGAYGWNARFDSWSGNAAVVQSGQLATDSNCAFGFAPALDAGMNTNAARATGAFSFKFTRRDGEQWLRGLTAKLPTGLLASVRDVPLCTNAQANAGTCPAGSKIGIVDAKAGSGDPFVLEQKGEVFLTEGYKGGEYGLAVKIRPIAGPFRGAMELSPIIVRQAIHVDRRTAQVTAVSDPFPLIHHGIPLRAREIAVLVDRPRFMLNPSDCSAKQVDAAIVSAEGSVANVGNRFQVAGCARLPFQPRLALALTGRKQRTTGKHPGVRAVVRQRGIGEAGIKRAEVRLPKSLALDPENAQALCEFEDGTKPDLENHCPKGSIVGRVRAVTPLLNDDLVGNVYFVKNVRIDPDTGNEIRTLPMIMVALRGEISINLRGESDTTKSGKLVNTFGNVPDAPISRFNLNIKGGKSGILAVTRTRRARINLCTKPRSHVAETDMDGHNGKRRDFNVRMKTPCRKRRASAAKVCRKRTDSKPAFRRCVVKVKRNRVQAKQRKAAKRKAVAKRRAAANRRR